MAGTPSGPWVVLACGLRPGEAARLVVRQLTVQLGAATVATAAMTCRRHSTAANNGLSMSTVWAGSVQEQQDS